MNQHNKKFLVKITFWLLAEIWLNFVGLDNIADYSEYIFERNKDNLVSHALLNREVANPAQNSLKQLLITLSAVPNSKLVTKQHYQD